MQTDPDLDILLAHEWYLSDETSYFENMIRTPQAVARIKSRLQESTQNRSTLLIPGTVTWVGEDGGYRNTALAVSSGQLLIEYSKQNDGGDNYNASNYGLIWKNGQEPGLFIWRTLKVGIEICADHAWGTLKGSSERANDLHIVVSCGMSLQEDNATMDPHGYFLLNDCFGRNQWAFVRTGDTTMAEISETSRGVLEFDPTRTLVTFDLPIPSP